MGIQVEFDPSKVSEDAIKNKIEEAGYIVIEPEM